MSPVSPHCSRTSPAASPRRDHWVFNAQPAGCSPPVCVRHWRFGRRTLWAALAWIALGGAAPGALWEPGVAWGQGGGIANAIGLSIENAANAAASRSNRTSAGSVASSGGDSSGGDSSGGDSSDGYGEDYDGGGDSSDGYGEDYDGGGDSSGGDSGGGELGDSYGEDYDGGDSSGGDSGGGSRRPAAAGGGGPAAGDVLAVASGTLAGAMAEFFNRPLPESATRFQPTLAEQAALALYLGEQRRSLGLFHAHLVAERDAAAAGLDAVRFSALLRRPVWALRLGVSLNAKAPAELADDLQPIREGDKLAAARGARGPGYGSDEDYGDSGEDYGGESDQLYAEGSFDGSSGEDSGEEMDASDGSMQSSGNAGPAAAKPASLPTTPGGKGTILAAETLDRHLGLIADVLKGELAARVSAGKFGTLWVELAPQGAALVEKVSPAAAAAIGPTEGALPMWIPGVDFLGMGLSEQSIQKAKQSGIDVLFHCDIAVKQTRLGDVQYVARCRAINVASGQTLGASKLMDKREVLLAARRSSAKAVVEELLRPVFEAVDSQAALLPMPPLVPQNAISRIDALLASPQPNRMQTLAEIVMFHHRGLIDDNQFEQAMFFAAGEDGLRLLYAEPEKRSALAASLVAKELGQN